MGELDDWLAAHGLGDYVEVFRHHHVDLADLELLSIDDVTELGLPLGPRRRLLRALAIADAERSPGPDPAADPERRQVTVLFCDVVGSTALSSRLDPEQYHDVVTRYQTAARDAIATVDGYVARYLGDGLLAVFGYPTAHEDDPERAVRGALAVLSAVDGIRAADGTPIEVRLGVSTGVVVAGDIAASGVMEDRTVLGDTPNLAARLQAEAEPGTVLISESTLTLVPGIFETVDRGPRSFKGIDAPVCVHEVRRVTGMRSRIAAESTVGLSPFVGRRAEFAVLRNCWRQACAGRGGAVVLVGDAGIGKSRLVHEFRRSLAEDQHTWLECRASPFTRASPFFPVVELLDEVLGLGDDDPDDRRVDLLRRGLESSGFTLHDHLPLLTALSSLPLPAGYREPFDTPPARRLATRQLLAEWLVRLGASQPTVLLVEDLQWLDASTAELLEEVATRLGSASILLVVTTRDAPDVGWVEQPAVTTVELGPLDDREGRQLVEEAVGRVDDDTLAAVVARTDGVPLYIEELARTVVEGVERGGDVASTAIPATLHDLLMARLDALGPARPFAQLASVLGPEFDLELVRHVTDADLTDLREGLDRAVEAGFLVRRRTADDESYGFRHAMLCDAAYESMLVSARRRHHGRVAEVLEREYPTLVEVRPELLAHHLERADRPADAREAFLRAGQLANDQGAFEEARRHLRRGLDLADRPPEPEPALLLSLWAALGRALRVAKGWAHPDTREAWLAAQDLCSNEVGDELVIPVQMGLGADHLNRGAPTMALDVGDDLRRLSPASVAGAVASGYLRGASLWYLGRFEEADAALRTVTDVHSPEAAFDVLDALDVDVGPGPHSYQAWTWWALGDADRAWALATRVVEERRTRARSFPLVSALGWAGALALYLRDFGSCRLLGAEAASVSEQQRIPQFEAIGTLLALSGTEAERGDASIADRYGEVIGGAAGDGNLGSAPIMLSALAGLQLRADRLDDAAASVALAQAIAEQTDQRFFDAELLRLGGVVEARRGQRLAAVASLRTAVDVARGQRARLLEVRAATDLVRIEGTDDARRVLESAIDSLPGANGTRDVREARAVLVGGGSR